MTDVEKVKLKKRAKEIYKLLKENYMIDAIKWGVDKKDYDAKDFQHKLNIVEKYFDEKYYSDLDPLRDDERVMDIVFTDLGELYRESVPWNGLLVRYFNSHKVERYNKILAIKKEIKILEDELTRLENMK